MSGLEKSVDEFTEVHVKGVIRPVDITNMQGFVSWRSNIQSNQDYFGSEEHNVSKIWKMMETGQSRCILYFDSMFHVRAFLDI